MIDQGYQEDRIPAHPSTPEGMEREGPRRVMLMTPHLVAIGGLIAFFTVVALVVILPINTYTPEPSNNWAPLSDSAIRGQALYTQNGCVYCHSGFTRPQDVFNGQYYLYTRVSEPGDFVVNNQGVNLLGSERTGPDLSQEGGHHPDDWHVAHYQNPRNVIPNSIMPRFNFLSDEEINDLIAFNQSAGGKEALLRYSAITVGKKLMTSNMGMGSWESKFPDLVAELKDSGEFNQEGTPDAKSPSDLPWKAVWHMNSFDRGYWLTQNPLPVTQQNLMRGKSIYLDRCAGCHGPQGDGNGTAKSFMMPTPFDFTSEEINGPGASPGQMYHRILTAGPGTAMENFGTRLSVEDIWRTVLFLRTIPNGGLEEDIPTPEMYEAWSPPAPMLTYIKNHPIEESTGPEADIDDPFMQAARWVAPGMAEGDLIMVGGQLPITLQRLRDLIEQEYMRQIEQAYNDAIARGETLPPMEQIMSTDSLTWHTP